MLTAQDSQAVRELGSKSELDDAKDDGNGYIYHGSEKPPRKAPPKNANLLHFAHCNKLNKIADGQTRILWFDRIRIASEHLNDTVDLDRWKWCKQCESEVTQKLLEQEGY